MSEVPDFHYVFFCSPDYYTVKNKYFYAFCALKILLENLGSFLLLLRPCCLPGTGICFYSRIWGFSSLLLSEDVKEEKKKEAPDNLSTNLVLFLASDFANP